MVISRWRIVHRQKGRCEDFDLKIPLYNIPDVDETFSIGAL
jgi:hypothetical protein